VAESVLKSPKLDDFIQAGYPAIFLRTIEPLVAEGMVKTALQVLGMDDVIFGIWKVTTGLMIGRIDSPEEAFRNVQNDLLETLEWIEDVKAERPPCIILLHNLRQFVGQYGIIQKMVDTIYRARLRGSHLILIGPALDLPPELRNIIQFVECPLPSRDKIAADYSNLVKAYAERLDLPKSKEERTSLIEAAATAAVGLDSMAAENAICLSMAVAEGIDIRIIQAQKEQEVRKSDVLEFFPTDEGLDTLGGFSALKKELGFWAEAFSQEARDYGLPYPKGFLIVGPAGTGKSLCAKATARYLRLPLLRFDLGKIFRSLVGESEAAVRQALAVAEAVAPVVIWMDEIEKGMAGMAGSGELDSGVTSRVVSTILTWRQETQKAVVLVATANNVLTLPSMVYRKGRMDEVWATDLPNLEEREEIFRIHLRKRKRDPKKFKIELLASETDEFVGAEIESCVVAGMFRAFKEKKEVSDRHIMSVIRDTIPQAQRDKEELTAIRNWVKTRARLVSGGEPPKPEPTKVRKLHQKGGK
jgi:ATP-dependent 26S proteasome regulatory subunit